MSWDLTSKDPQFNFNMREVSGKKVYEFEDFRLDAVHLLLFRGDEQLRLAPKVIETLLALVERDGDVLSKDELMARVWPDSIVEESNLSQNLYLLRKTLGTMHTGEPFIETLRRRGYRFAADVRVAETGYKALETGRPVKVERSENIYSVIDWQREAGAELATENDIGEAKTADRPWRVPLLIALGCMTVVIAAVVVTGVFSRRNSAAPPANARELTFTHVTTGIEISDATISSDGNTIVYHESDGEMSQMFVQQTGQSTRHPVMPPTRKALLSKTFAPDGRSIYFIEADTAATTSALFRVPSLGGVPTKIADGVGSTVAVSPDGQQIAFLRFRRPDETGPRSVLKIAFADGSGERVLITPRENYFIWGGLAWSPDGRAIAYGEVDQRLTAATGMCTIQSVDPDGLNVRQLSPEKWDGCSRMEWSNDGKGLFFIGTRGGEGLTTRRDQLFRLAVDTGEARRVTTEGSRHQGSSLGVTRDNAVLVVPFDRPSQLWSMDANGDSRTARQITSGRADGRAGLASLPDGRIAYITRAGADLSVWLAGEDGAQPRQITSQPEYVEELRVTPDGAIFYFSALIGGKHVLYRSDSDGSNVRPALEDEALDVDSAISPDGKWLVYNATILTGPTPVRGLRMTPIAGGEIRDLITDRDASTPHFSPDGRYISVIGTDSSLYVVTFPDGRSVARFKPATGAILNVGARWSPEGTALVYVVKNGAVGNLWLQPIDSSPGRPLTDFTSGEVYNFTFTTDAKRIILARGYPIRDAVLISDVE